MEQFQRILKHQFFIPIFSVGCVILIVIVLNRWIAGQVDELSGKLQKSPVVSSVQTPQPEKIQSPKGEATRRSILDPSRTFLINQILIDGKEVAHFNSIGMAVSDFEGEIPDGKIKFIDESNQTYGDEFYRNNTRHGPYREFYNNGNIKKEIEYVYGKIVTIKEYFFDGSLRMEADYSDALISNDKESGKGAIYYRSGVKMYEWNMTNFDKNRFKKSYNVKGELVETKTYDSKGELVDKITHPVAM